MILVKMKSCLQQSEPGLTTCGFLSFLRPSVQKRVIKSRPLDEDKIVTFDNFTGFTL